jgi:hypothetical protein
MLIKRTHFIILSFLCLNSFISCGGGGSSGNETSVANIPSSIMENTNNESIDEVTDEVREINLSSCASCDIVSNDNGLFVLYKGTSKSTNLEDLVILQTDDNFQVKQGVTINLNNLFDSITSSYDLRFASGTSNHLYVYLVGHDLNYNLTESFLIVLNTENSTISKILKFIPQEITNLNSELDLQRILMNENSIYIEGPGLFWIFDKDLNLIDKFKLWNGFDYYFSNNNFEYFFGLNSANLFDNKANKTTKLINRYNYNYYSTLLDNNNSILISGGYYAINNNMKPSFSIIGKDFSYHEDFIIPELKCYYSGFYLVLQHNDDYLLIGNAKETTSESNNQLEGLIVAEIDKNGNLVNNVFLPNTSINMVDKSSSFSSGEKVFVRTNKGILILNSELEVINSNNFSEFKKLKLSLKNVSADFELQQSDGFCLNLDCASKEKLETELKYVEPNIAVVNNISPKNWKISF